MNFEKFSQGYYIIDVGKSKLIVKGDMANSPKMYDFIGESNQNWLYIFKNFYWTLNNG